MWNFVGNRIFGAHIRSNAQATETEPLEVGVFFCGAFIVA
jgi:hypothetical protein